MEHLDDSVVVVFTLLTPYQILWATLDFGPVNYQLMFW